MKTHKLLMVMVIMSHSMSLFAQGLEWAGHFFVTQNSDSYTPTISHVDVAGNLYTAGYMFAFEGSVDLDPSPDTAWLTTATHCIYLQKLDSAGHLAWAKELVRASANTGENIITAIAVDASGYIHVSGYFKGTADFDPGPGTFYMTSQSTQNNFFVQKLDAAGNLIWAKRMGGNIFDDDIARDIKIDPFGNILLTGTFSQTADFDPGPGVVSLTAIGSQNTFILKLKPDGTLDWVRQLTNPFFPQSGLYNSGEHLSVDPEANVYLAGNFRGETDFDPGPDTLMLENTEDGSYILKLNADGGFIWVRTFHAADFNYLGTDTLGNLVAACNIGDTTDFDPGPGTYALSYGTVVFKWAKDSTLAWVRGIYHLESVLVAPNGNVSIMGVYTPNSDINPNNTCQTTPVPYTGSLRYYVRTLDPDGYCLWSGRFDVHSDGERGFLGIDGRNNMYVRARFTGTTDFDPDPNVTAWQTSTVPWISDIFVLKLNQYPKIRGIVFWDKDQDLERDTLEPGISGAIVQVLHRNMYLSTDTAGRFYAYSSNIDNDTLCLIAKSPQWTVQPSCQVPDTMAANLEFAVAIPPGFLDVALYAQEITPFRRGFTNDILLQVNNLGAVQTDSILLTFQVKLQSVPVPVNLAGAIPAPVFQSNDSIVWKLPGLDPFETRQVHVSYYTPTAAQLGAPLQLVAWVETANDADSTNNTAEIRSAVTGSFDPNDKRVFPDHLLPAQLDSTRLQYLIRFQNTGTYPAEFVIIRDTLPAGLDIASLQMIGASHPYTWRLYGQGILEVRFDMIHLPDSTTDEAGSHGFAAFSIKPGSHLVEGDAVVNRAAIFFDYNDPIITHPAVLWIGAISSAPEQIYNEVPDFTLSPNPAARQTLINVSFPEEISGKIEVLVMDLNGRIVQQIQPNSRQIKLAGMRPGAYIVQVKMEKGGKSKLLIIE